MKKVIAFFVLLLIFGSVYGQERQQKEAAREQRSFSQKVPNYEPPRFNRPYVAPLWNDPFIGRRWVSPYDFWIDDYYYDRWGYRNRARVYHYKGRRDTIRQKSFRFSFGAQISTNDHAGAFLTLGDRSYFIIEYNQIFQADRSIFYPDLTMDKVLQWNDQRLENIRKGNIFYLGFGKKIARTGLHALIGFGSSESRYQFFDELFILSNNGRYSIREFRENFTTIKIGALHDLKRVTLKIDYNPLRNQLYFGTGINF